MKIILHIVCHRNELQALFLKKEKKSRVEHFSLNKSYIRSPPITNIFRVIELVKSTFFTVTTFLSNMYNFPS